MLTCSIDWGTVPQWLGLATAVIGVAAFTASRRDLARGQASAVYVIVKSHWYRSRFVEQDGQRKEIASIELEADVVNPTSKPITECSLSLYAPGGRRRPLWWTSRSPHDWWSAERLTGRSLYTIAPESTGETFDHEQTITPPDSPPRGLPTLILAFTDGDGRRWTRWPNGQVRRVRPWLMLRGRRPRHKRVNA